MNRIASVIRHFIERACFAVGSGHRVYVWPYMAHEMVAWCAECLPRDRWRYEENKTWVVGNIVFRHLTDAMMFRLRWSEQMAVHRESVEREIQKMKERRVDDLKHMAMFAVACSVIVFLLIAVMNLFYDIIVWIVR